VLRAGRAVGARACAADVRVRKAGAVRLTCTLTTRARALRGGGPVTVRLTTTFTPTGGTASERTQTVVLPRR